MGAITRAAKDGQVCVQSKRDERRVAGGFQQTGTRAQGGTDGGELRQQPWCVGMQGVASSGGGTEYWGSGA